MKRPSPVKRPLRMEPPTCRPAASRAPRRIAGVAVALLLSPIAADAVAAGDAPGAGPECAKRYRDEVEHVLDTAESCAQAAAIYRACVRKFEYSTQLPSALRARCEREFDGRLTKAERARYDRALAACARSVGREGEDFTRQEEKVVFACQALEAVRFSSRPREDGKPK